MNNYMNKSILFMLMIQILCYANTQEISNVQPLFSERQAKDLYHYQRPEDQFKSDYSILTYSPSHYPREEGFHECSPNSITSFIARQLNFILLKLGVVAIVKTILTGLFLLKIPLFFLKVAFLKTFLFPVLIAPLLLHFLSNQETSVIRPQEEERPIESSGSMGRIIENDDDLSTKIWRSLKVFAESERCVERFACMFGAHNKDSSNKTIYSRALKVFERSSPQTMQKRISSIKEAYKKGVRDGHCSEQDFICYGPELFIEQGANKVKIL